MKLSIVIPAHNEEENVDQLFQEIKSSLPPSLLYEIIYVNDGSTDKTFSKANDYANKNNHLKILEFGRKSGQTAALTAGIDLAQGEVIVLMDADLQNDPKDILLMLDEISRGCDVVVGWRKNRKDDFFSRTLPSIVANFFVKKFTGVNVHDLGCTLKAFRKEFIVNIRLYGEMHRFIPLYVHALGGNIKEIVVNHRPRLAGKTKYNIFKAINFCLDLITTKFLLTYSTKPMHFFGRIGLLCFMGSGTAFTLIITHRFIYSIPISENALLSLSVILFVVSVNFVLMGLFSEMQIRTYYESQKKNTYFVTKRINFD
jgi:glycosyltransferase involved in cell wall biosynthesis